MRQPNITMTQSDLHTSDQSLAEVHGLVEWQGG
jgi:hypothetical protein